MTTHPDDIDRRLRTAFDADPASVERVAAAASSGNPVRRRQPGGVRMLRFALAAVVVLLLAIGVWRLQPAPDLSPSGGLDGWFAGDVLVAPIVDGSVAIVGPGTRDDRPPDGLGIVLVSGEDR